ncbi:MAG: NADPH-dependent 7-cyano-7-deazaguanine reductase QueF [Pirellulales bacterium]
MNTSPEASLLGKPSTYVSHYDPSLLYPMARQPKRDEIGITGALPFFGADLWTAYEVSWLNRRGKPEVAIARFTVPAESTHIVESKSLKLYLNSFSSTHFDDPAAVSQRIEHDLSQAFWHQGPVTTRVMVDVATPESWSRETVGPLEGVLLDVIDVACTAYQPAPDLLSADMHRPAVTESLVTNLLKSNCLVTGQPDWGSLRITYTGPPIDHAGLLQYIVSYRSHNEFHEPCVERIFMDLTRRCRPARLEVYARYTRRGGLDINPWRSSHPVSAPTHIRTARQ